MVDLKNYILFAGAGAAGAGAAGAGAAEAGLGTKSSEI